MHATDSRLFFPLPLEPGYEANGQHIILCTCTCIYVWPVIFVIFMIDLAVTKFSHPRKLMPTMIWVHDDGRGHKHIVAARPTFSSVSKQQ